MMLVVVAELECEVPLIRGWCGGGSPALGFKRFAFGISMPTRSRPAPKRRITAFPIRLEPSRRARLEELAKAEHRTLSNYILKVLYDHIDAMDAARNKSRK
jgi:hypothetical protein